jgi:NADPH2:quinone reductase
MMRAFVCSQITDDLAGTGLADIPPPSAGAGRVVVRMRAAGVNFPDVLMCRGLYQFKPEPPFVPGMEVAGEVVEAGEGAARFAPGDLVVGGAGVGGFAEFCALPETSLRRLPAGVDPAIAAGFQAAYLTAYVALVRRARIEPGETLLVHGAAGGVGLAAVDLGRMLGARVIATASTPEKRAFLQAYGVAAALEPSGFRDAVKDLTSGRGADVIYDPVGGDVFDESVRAIAFDGRLLVIGFTSGRIPSVSVNMPLIKGFSVIGVRAGEYGRQFPERGRENLDAIWSLLEAGRLRPHVHARLPLAETRAALALLQTRSVIGKVVIVP